MLISNSKPEAREPVLTWLPNHGKMGDKAVRIIAVNARSRKELGKCVLIDAFCSVVRPISEGRVVDTSRYSRIPKVPTREGRAGDGDEWRG